MKGETMAIRIDPMKCTACALCEEACSYYHDEAFSLLSSSIMLYRSEEKKNYLGLILKLEDSLVLGKAEGVEQAKIGELASKGGGGASAKPILIREACDGCSGLEAPWCVRFCPTGALEQEVG
jgi:Fe-S-cluster-containing dehydrogenase component